MRKPTSEEVQSWSNVDAICHIAYRHREAPSGLSRILLLVPGSALDDSQLMPPQTRRHAVAKGGSASFFMCSTAREWGKVRITTHQRPLIALSEAS